MITDDWREFQKSVSRLVARAWLDDSFKQRLIAEPKAVLAENGLTLPPDVEVRVNENATLGTITNADNQMDGNLVYEIPLPSKSSSLTDEQIQSWSDGSLAEAPVDIPLCA